MTQRIRAILDGRPIDDLTADEEVARVIDEGRAAFQEFGLGQNHFLGWRRDTLIFPWVGAKLTETLVLALRREGLKATTTSFAITVEDTTPEAVKAALKVIPADLDLEELAREARQLQQDKFDRQLIPYYLRMGYARRALTTHGLPEILQRLIDSGKSLAA